LGRKVNLSGISPAKRSRSGPNSVYVEMSRDDNVRGILGTIGPFWAKLAGASPTEREFFCVIIHATFLQLHSGWFLPNLVTKRTSVSRRGIRKDIFGNFYFWVICPQNLKSKIRQTGTSLRASYRSRDALQRDTVYSTLYSRGQGVSEIGQLFSTTYGCRSTGCQSCSVFGFWSIFPIQNPKNVPFGDQPTAHGLHRRMITIFPCGSWRSKGVLSGSAVFLRLLVGELDQRCLKTCNSKDGYTFPPNIFAPTPKITQKPNFGGLFSANPIRALCKSRENGATKLKRYRYIGIGKYFRVCQNFSTRGVRGVQGPLM